MVHIEKKTQNSLTDGMVQRGEKTCIRRRHQSSAPVWMFAEHVQFYPNSLMSGCFSPSKKDGNIVPKKTESFSRCYPFFRCYYHGWSLKNHPSVGYFFRGWNWKLFPSYKSSMDFGGVHHQEWVLLPSGHWKRWMFDTSGPVSFFHRCFVSCKAFSFGPF